MRSILVSYTEANRGKFAGYFAGVSVYDSEPLVFNSQGRVAQADDLFKLVPAIDAAAPVLNYFCSPKTVLVRRRV